MLLCPQAAGELVDLQKVSATADGCVFSGLRAGSLYRLQVVSWSRDMSSDSSTLARTGELTRQRAEIQNETPVEVLRVRGSDRIQFLSGYFGFLCAEGGSGTTAAIFVLVISHASCADDLLVSFLFTPLPQSRLRCRLWRFRVQDGRTD